MAERLTEKNSIDNKRYMLNSEENTVCVTNARLNNCSTIAYCWGKPIDKLAQLEDILEKYGIDVEELDNALEFAKVIEKTLSEYGIKDNEELEELLDDNKYAQNVVVKQLVELQNAKNEENTWKKACELACSKLVDYEWDNKESTHSAQYWFDYFYQQAKTEGNDERD